MKATYPLNTHICIFRATHFCTAPNSGSWFTYNLNFWNLHRNDENFLFLKYEDMKQVSVDENSLSILISGFS